MLASPRILIASVFGRGNLLAVELHRLGFNVQLVDVTSRLSTLSPEDLEGPFGYFNSPKWQGSESDFLNSFGQSNEVTQGLSLWLKSGPWNLRGSNANHRAEVLNQNEKSIHFVKHCGDLQQDRKNWILKLQELEFDKRWIASLAADFMSNKSQWPNEAFAMSLPATLFESYLARTPERFDLVQSLRWCSEQGVVVTENADIPDVAIDHKHLQKYIQGIEVSSEKSGFVRCHQLIWLLTSLETEKFSPRVFTKLYKDQKIEPEWCWLRYKVNFEQSLELTELPQEFLFIEDLSIPWSHDNFAIFRRGENPQSFHIWLRLPFSQRFHQDYLTDRIKPLLENLKKRCVRLQVLNIELPIEASSNSKILGAPLFPLYRAQDLAHPPGISVKNLWFNHSERWPSYSWGPIFSTQAQITSQLQKWWGELTAEQKQKELQQ